MIMDHVQRHTPIFKRSPAALSGVNQTLLRLWWLGREPPDYTEDELSHD